MRFPQLRLPTEFAWLDDPEIWTPIPGLERVFDSCYAREGASDKLEFPTLEWLACGDGCSKTDVLQGLGSVAGEPMLSTARVNGTAVPYLHLGQGPIITLDGRLAVVLARTIDLSTGRTVAATERIESKEDESAGCVGVGGLDSALTFEIGSPRQDGAATPYVRGLLDPETGATLWQLPWVTKAEMGIDPNYCQPIEISAGGRILYTCGNSVWGATTPRSSEIAMVDRPTDFFVKAGSSEGDLAVWAELARDRSGSRVRGWKPDGAGVRTLLDGVPVDTCGVGISDTHVVGFSTAGGCDSYQHMGRLWIAERTAEDGLTNLRIGTVFWPNPVVMVRNVETWGDFSAAVWAVRSFDTQSDRQRLLLARTTDWAMRYIKAPEGREVWEAGLSADYLYVVYAGIGAQTGNFSELYRYELSKFEQIGEVIEPVQEQ